MNDQSNESNDPGCCSSVDSNAGEPIDSADQAGRLSTPAAIGAAVLSSACCWLPLLLLAFGVSAGGIAGFFERTRPVFLVVTAILLAISYYFTYFRKPVCKPGDACATPPPKMQRFNRVILWVATVFIAAFALFPYYSPAIVRMFAHSGRDAAAVNPVEGANGAVAASTVRIFQVEGMTCASCAAMLEVQLSALPGVENVRVSFDDATVTIRSPAEQPSKDLIRDSIEKSGFKLAGTIQGQ